LGCREAEAGLVVWGWCAVRSRGVVVGGWVGGWVGEQRRRRQLPWRGGRGEGLGWSGLGVQGWCIVWGGQGLLVDPRRHRQPNF